MALLAINVSFMIGIIGCLLIYVLKYRQGKKLVGFVCELRTHPVKSGKPLHLSSTEVTPLGLKHDRQFVLVNKYGTFMTLRKHQKLVLISQETTDNGIILDAEGMASLKLPLRMSKEDGDHWKEVTVFRKKGTAVHVSDEADQWFSTYLGEEGCSLYCFPTDGVPRFSEDRGVKVDNYVNDKDTLMFADDCPLLIASQSSLGAVNEKIKESVTMDHFRPNIVVSGSMPFAEDSWKTIEINNVQLQSLYPCGRCNALNVDPFTGDLNENILPQMLKARPASEGDYPKIKGVPLFGMNYGVRKEGVIRIGDPVYEVTR